MCDCQDWNKYFYKNVMRVFQYALIYGYEDAHVSINNCPWCGCKLTPFLLDGATVPMPSSDLHNQYPLWEGTLPEPPRL